MAGEKMNSLLTDEEKDQLVNRSDYDRQILSANDLRIKKKLKAWLDDIEDVHLILRNLPEDLNRDVLTDEYVFDLLSIATDIMRLLQFLSICGEVDEPEEWKARGYGIIRQAEDKDIGRSLILNSHLKDLVVFTGESLVEGHNPAVRARALARLKEDPRHSGEITPEERKAIERVDRAMAKYAKLRRFADLRSGA